VNHDTNFGSFLFLVFESRTSSSIRVSPIYGRLSVVAKHKKMVLVGTYTMLVEQKNKNNNSTSEARSKREVHPGYFGIPADDDGIIQ
jgi:hypothetical protein